MPATPKDIPKILEKLLGRLQSQAEMNKLGLAGIRMIRKRTREGKDVEGKSFKPYSEAHKKRRTAKGLPTHIVTLEFSDVADTMLSHMDHVVSNDFSDVVLQFDNPWAKKIASYHSEKGVGKAGANIRKFFGLSDDEEQKLGEIVEMDLNNFLEDLTAEAN